MQKRVYITSDFSSSDLLLIDLVMLVLVSPAEVGHGLANSDVGEKLQPIFTKQLVSGCFVTTHCARITIQSPYLLYKKYLVS